MPYFLDKSGAVDEVAYVLVKDGCKNLHAFEMLHNDVTVCNVKAKIEDKLGFPPDDQRLVFLGKKLADDHVLDIPAGALLHLVLKLEGGGKLGTKKKLKAEKMHVAMAKATYLGGFLRDF